jgi:predicted RNase H-like HicB family nuclease
VEGGDLTVPPSLPFCAKIGTTEVVGRTTPSLLAKGSEMQRVNIVYWEEQGAWLGYLQEYPDYWTQGETLEDLKEHLKDLYQDITGGEIPGIRKVGELEVA